jgi:hypothetical protein
LIRRTFIGGAAGRGHRPEIEMAAFDNLLPLGLPVTHIEAVRHDARSGLQFFEQFRAEALIDVKQQI